MASSPLSPGAPRAASGPLAPAAPAAPDVAATRWLAVGCLLGLIVLSLAWELWLAPLRPGGSWLALKALPLAVPLAGLLKHRMYTYRWVSLVVWLYFTEGVVRAPSALGMTVGSPPSSTATTEFVVPRSIPTARAMSKFLRELL